MPEVLDPTQELPPSHPVNFCFFLLRGPPGRADFACAPRRQHFCTLWLLRPHREKNRRRTPLEAKYSRRSGPCRLRSQPRCRAHRRTGQQSDNVQARIDPGGGSFFHNNGKMALRPLVEKEKNAGLPTLPINKFWIVGHSRPRAK